MELFYFLLRASRKTVVLAIVAGVISGFTSMGVLVLIRLWMRHRDHSESQFALFAGIFVAVCASAMVSRLASQFLLISLSKRAVAQLGAHLSRRVLAAPLKHLENLGPARLQAILTNDIPTIAQGLNAVPLLCANLAMIVACLAFLAWLSMPISAMVFGLMVVGFCVQALLMKKAQAHMRQTRDGQENVIGQVRHLVEGIKELKVHRGRRDAFLTQSLQPALDDQEKQSTRARFLMSISNSWGKIVFFVLIGFLLFVFPSVAGVQHDHEIIGIYFIAIFFTMIPLEGLKQTIPMLSRAKASLDKVEILGLDLAAVEAETMAAGTAPSWDCLELAGATHAYKRERDEKGFLLGPLDVTFRRGEMVFLVGGNGSGKTTLAKLLTGLYVPEKGEVRLDGKPVTAADREGYRQLFAVVFSEFHLFPNLIGLGSPELDALAREHLVQLQLDHKVKVVKGVLSNVQRLSRGQRKRLALLTACLEDRSFYVFDEWAADQDPHFKDVFYTQLLPQLKARGKTALVITHDDRYYYLADRLLRLEDGKLLPEGSDQVQTSLDGTVADMPQSPV